MIEALAPFAPSAWQKVALKDTSPVLLLTGPSGGGKSACAAEKLHLYCMKYPGATALALRKTRESTRNSIVSFFQESVFGNDPRIRHKPSDYRFEYPNGSVIIYGGMKDKAQQENLKSVGKRGGVDIAWMEEATGFTSEDFDAVMARMRGNRGDFKQVILTTNPDSPYHWIKQRLIGDDVVDHSGNVKAYRGRGAMVVESRPEDNPANTPDYIEFLKSMAGVMYQRLYLGLWVQADGMVYSEWDNRSHICKRFDIPDSWRRFITFDFGYSPDPFVAQFWAYSEDKKMYLTDEIYFTNRLVEDHCVTIKEVMGDDHYEAFICDHDKQERMILEKNLGVSTMLANKSIMKGIQATKKRLKKDRDGVPGLMIFEGSTWEEDPLLRKAHQPIGAYQEIYHYVWNPKKTDTPVDKFNHGMDAMRYGVAYVDGFNTVSVASVRNAMEKLRKQRAS